MLKKINPYQLIPTSLSELLNGINTEIFISDFLGRHSHLSRLETSHQKYGEESLEQFELLLWSHEQRLQKHLCVEDSTGPCVTPRRRASKDLFRWAVDQYMNGKILTLADIQDIEPTAADLARDVAQHLLAKVSLDFILIPQATQLRLPFIHSFGDIFVVQLRGESKYSASLAGGLNSLETITGTLKSSDALYIPNIQCLSLSPCVGYSSVVLLRVLPFTSGDYLDCLIEVATENISELRKTLPLNESALSAYRSSVTLLSKCATDPDMRKLAWEKLRLRIADSYRPNVGGHLSVAQCSNNFNSTTLVQVRKGAIYAFAEVDTGVYVYVPGLGGVSESESLPGGLIFPKKAMPLLEWISEKNCPFCANDLPKDFSKNARMATVHRLLLEGALELCPPNITS